MNNIPEPKFLKCTITSISKLPETEEILSQIKPKTFTDCQVNETISLHKSLLQIVYALPTNNSKKSKQFKF